MAGTVVVTGIGMVTPVGNDTASAWRAICEGQSGGDLITAFDATQHPVRIAAEVKGFDPLRYMDRKSVRRNDLYTHYALAAARQALDDAHFTIDEANADMVGVIMPSGSGGLHALDEQFHTLFEKGPARVSPLLMTMLETDMASGSLSLAFGARGPNFAIVSACATSANAIGEAAEIIKRGDAVAMIAGGSEAGVTSMGVAAFAATHALSRRNDDPTRASRPFDAQRDGLVIGEGAGALLLEDEGAARKRGARIYAELVSYAATSDAHHIVEPAPGGAGLVRAIRRAMRKGGVSPEDIGYINAHGTSTVFNDSAETEAIKTVFGAHAYRLAVSSTKSMLGHTFGAAGAIEAGVTILALHHGILPPTINLEHPDPACDLDYVPNVARPTQVEVALSNSMGFGGHNATLIFRRVQA